jgi:hypothetical protein
MHQRATNERNRPMNPTPPPVKKQPNPPVEKQSNPSPDMRPKKHGEKDFEREDKYQRPPGTGTTRQADAPDAELTGPGDARVDGD